MGYKAKAWLVSELMSEDRVKQDQQFASTSNVQSPQFTDLMGAVGEELRDVKFCRMNYRTAIVYREGDVFALGEIGYRDVSVKGAEGMKYYVHSRLISNEKYKDSSWQHRVLASKSLKNAVKAASTYLRQYSGEEIADNTHDAVRQIVQPVVESHHSAARLAYRDLTGEAGYASNMNSEFISELRNHTFVSPKLNEAAARFYAAKDAWDDAKKAMSNGLHMVAVSDNYGQRVADLAKVEMNYPYKVESLGKRPLDSLDEWVHGRIAVLSMMPPQTYVQGVGTRLDDRVFYIAEEK